MSNLPKGKLRLTRKQLLIGGGLFLLLLVVACPSSKRGIDPNSWTCAALVDDVIEMSKEHDAQLLEITKPKVWTNGVSTSQIDCMGDAEWSEGVGSVCRCRTYSPQKCRMKIPQFEVSANPLRG